MRSWPRGSLLLVVCLCSAFLGLETQVLAHAGLTLSGIGTAAIDGVMSPTEWDRAASYAFAVNLPGGGTAPATLWVMNDPVNLYTALRFALPPDQTFSAPLYFDNDHDGIAEIGDDAFGCNTNSGLVRDLYRHSTGFSGDVTDGGTLDGQAASGSDGNLTVCEASHPLDSADDLHDFSLAAGATVGVEHGYVSVCDSSRACSETYLFDAFDIGVAAAAPVSLALFGDFGGTLQSGSELEVGVRLTNAGVPGNADLFFGILLPDASTLVFFTSLGFNAATGSLSDPAGWRPIVSRVELLDPFIVTVPAFFSYTFSGIELGGSYTFFLMAALPGAFADGAVDPGDILALGSAALTFSP